MPSVPEPTILDFIGNWFPWECSVVAARPRSGVRLVGRPRRLLECAESAPHEARQKLDRVKSARQALGFDRGHEQSYYLRKPSGLMSGGSIGDGHGRVPPVFGQPFPSPHLKKGQILEGYYIHGLSRYTQMN